MRLVGAWVCEFPRVTPRCTLALVLPGASNHLRHSQRKTGYQRVLFGCNVRKASLILQPRPQRGIEIAGAGKMHQPGTAIAHIGPAGHIQLQHGKGCGGKFLFHQIA